MKTGTATKLAFTTQPGNTAAGNIISGPPTVAIQDALGNTVTSSSASVTISIGTNPGSGTLGGTTTVSASSGVAAFTGLTINQAGTGYTLAASSSGLTSATSNAFNITASSGTIAGVVTRVSDGTAITGALVEAFQGTILVGSATTNGTGNYSISGLTDGVYTIQASATGFVRQILSGVTIINAGTATANLSLNVGIAIYSPLAGTVINDFSMRVTGEFDTSLGEVGINVNGYIAMQDGNELAALVPVDVTTTSLTATAASAAGSGTTLSRSRKETSNEA